MTKYAVGYWCREEARNDEIQKASMNLGWMFDVFLEPKAIHNLLWDAKTSKKYGLIFRPQCRTAVFHRCIVHWTSVVCCGPRYLELVVVRDLWVLRWCETSGVCCGAKPLRSAVVWSPGIMLCEAAGFAIVRSLCSLLWCERTLWGSAMGRDIWNFWISTGRVWILWQLVWSLGSLDRWIDGIPTCVDTTSAKNGWPLRGAPGTVVFLVSIPWPVFNDRPDNQVFSPIWVCAYLPHHGSGEFSPNTFTSIPAVEERHFHMWCFQPKSLIRFFVKKMSSQVALASTAPTYTMAMALLSTDLYLAPCLFSVLVCLCLGNRGRSRVLWLVHERVCVGGRHNLKLLLLF